MNGSKISLLGVVSAGALLLGIGAAAAQAQDVVVGLPRELSPWAMFLSADIVVKAVMIGLAFASLVTWTVGLVKFIEIRTADRWLGRAFGLLKQSPSLEVAAEKLRDRHRIGRLMIEAALDELRLSAGRPDNVGIKERVQSCLSRVEIAAAKSIGRGTGLLATIGATAPFVGLFGTVWGIMNSFIGISKSQTTNLAVVAPGIAEALLATAIGLVAAIPAVIIYNQLSRAVTSYRIGVADVGASVMRLASRDLDPPSAASRMAAE
ncbi:MAG: tonB-system energizer ExbB [Xanthobacteraceae bacterium]|nr:tonB-system energizer ExbB [Xanthobacteraceae bacterium]